MRLAGQYKLGYYPAHHDAVAALATHFAFEGHGPFPILDPCAGEGRAVLQIARECDIDQDDVYGVELDASRTRTFQALAPKARILGPASFHCTRISPGSFSLIYLNPPFDDELGGGKREEQTFVENAVKLLAARGILALVIPQDVLSRASTLQTLLDCHLEDGAIYKFPDEVRPFREVVVLGRKRKKQLQSSAAYREGFVSNSRLWDTNLALPALGSDHRKWVLPPGNPPKLFRKSNLTEQELIEHVEASPLNRIFDAPPEHSMGLPPLPPFTAHIAQLLASGILDGVVEPEGEDPHVVRGSARKDFEKSDETSTVDENTGIVTNKVTLSQVPKIVIRTIDRLGTLRTLETGATATTNEGADADV